MKLRIAPFALLKRLALRLLLIAAVFWGGGIALFSVLPVPFSAVMLERQISAWLSGDVHYLAHSDWVAMDKISPWMGLEAGLTVGMETVWSKKRILTVYLNIAEFGEGIFGVEAAAQRYFHKPASQLTPGEAALLAAVLPNPIRYRADAPSGYVRNRQAWILRQMRQLGGEGFMREHKLY